MQLNVHESKLHTKLPQVLRGALRLFIRKGIHATTIKDIAREAGVAEGALYRHYKSKEELAWDLFNRHMNAFTQTLRARVFTSTSAQERIRHFVEDSFSAYESDPELYTYLILQEHRELQKFGPGDDHPGKVVMDIIRDGQAASHIRSGDPFVLGSLVIGGIVRVAVVKMYGAIQDDLRNQTAPVSEALWAMLKQA